MENIRDICKSQKYVPLGDILQPCGTDTRSRSKFWRDSNSVENGRAAWQRITVALIADGLKPMDKSVLDIFATIGIFQDGVVKESVNGKPTTAHIFEVGVAGAP